VGIILLLIFLPCPTTSWQTQIVWLGHALVTVPVPNASSLVAKGDLRGHLGFLYSEDFVVTKVESHDQDLSRRELVQRPDQLFTILKIDPVWDILSASSRPDPAGS